MPDIFINTERPVDRSIVAGLNQPQREAKAGAFVAGSSYDINLYFVRNDGTYDPVSGEAGQTIDLAIAPISAPQSGTFTLSDGTDTTDALSYGASAQTVEDALNALNSATGPNCGTASLVDVVKESDGQYAITFRTLGANGTALTGTSVSLYPESTITGSVAVTGTASIYGQQVVEITRQPAVYQNTWSEITNGHNATVALNTTRLLQSMVLERGEPFWLEVKLNGATVAREIVSVEESNMPASAFSGAAIQSLLDAFAADPTSNASFDSGAWVTALGVGGTGDVVGPASATDNAIVRFDTTTGKLVQDSPLATIDDSGNIAANNLSGTNTGDVTFSGTGTYISIAGQVITVDPITESDISDLQAYLTGITGEPLTDLSDVTITTPSTGQVLRYNGSAWVNATLTEADISDLQTYLTAADIDTLAELNAVFTDGTVLIDTTDSRLSDARTPTAHTHTSDEITNNTSESTGVLTGGVLSTGAGAAEFSISDGTGQIVTAAGAVTAVSFSGLSNITPTNIATNLLTWVGIDSGGNLVEKVTAFTSNEIRNTIVLGVIVHTDNTTVQTVNNQQVATYQPLSTAYDIADAIGFVNKSGNVFSANGANMNINKSAGVMFKIGSNYDSDTANPHNKTLAAITPVTFEYRYSDGSSQAPWLTTIDPDNLDDGAGGNTAVGNNRWSVQRIYSFVSNNVKLQRGVEDFATKSAAIEGIASEAYVTEPSIAANGLLRGWLVLKKGATDLSDPAQAQFIEAPKFGESSAGGASTPPGDASVILIETLKATAGTITAGSVVRTTGYNGTRVLIELADADAAGETPGIGIARETITDAIAGNVVVFGKLEGIDTSTFSVADTLYLSTTPGVLTNTRPTGATTGIQAIARVLDVDATNGIVEVVGAGRTNALPQMNIDTMWYGDGTGTPAETSITAAGRAILDDASASAQRTTLGLGTADNPQFATIELGAATDTTLSRVSAGVMAVEGNTVLTNDTTIYDYIFVSAGAMIPRTTGGATSETLNFTTAGDDIMIDVMAFADAPAAEEGCGFWLTFPTGWDAGTVQAKFFFTTDAGTPGTTTVKFDIAAGAFADNDAIDAALGTEQSTTYTFSSFTNKDMAITSKLGTALTIGGNPSDGEPIWFEITRDTATDTFAEDAKLIGVEIEFARKLKTSAWA